MKNIFLCATEYETENIFDKRKLKVSESFPYKTYSINTENMIILTGVGKANSAAATQYLLKYNPKHIFNLGLAGSLDNTHPIGKTFIVSSCRNWDTDATSFGYKFGQIPVNGLETYCLNARITDLDLPSVSLISGDSFITDSSMIRKNLELYNPTLLDMELVSIAHVLHVNNSLDKLVSVKAISDYINKDSTKDFYSKKFDVFKDLREIPLRLMI